MVHDVAVVLPAFNEAISIAKVIQDMHAALPQAYLVVVDNCSTDGTGEVARNALVGITGIVLNETIQGKAQAVRRAFLSVDARVYVLCDADDTYPVDGLASVVARVANGDLDMAIGDRHGNGSYADVESRPMHGFGNELIAWMLARIFHGEVRDALSGLRVMSRAFVKNYPILARGFTLEVDMTAFALDRRMRMEHFVIDYRRRPAGSSSKLRTVPDGLRVVSAVINLARHYKPFGFFGFASLLLALASIGLGTPVVLEFIKTGLVPRLPTAVLAAGLGTSSLIALAIALVLDSSVQYQRAMTEIALMQTRGSGI